MSYLEYTLNRLARSSPGQTEFFQAVEEVLVSLKPLLDRDPRYMKHNILDRIVEPERQVIFRVS